jgi:hypothetical protein
MSSTRPRRQQITQPELLGVAVKAAGQLTDRLRGLTTYNGYQVVIRTDRSVVVFTAVSGPDHEGQVEVELTTQRASRPWGRTQLLYVAPDDEGVKTIAEAIKDAEKDAAPT